MPPPERFEILAPLPSAAGFRRALAIERGGAPRAVVLQFPPARVADDASRLAALVRDAEAAARVHHPHAIPVAGLETVRDAPAVVEVHRAGPTLRELLDAGGRLPADVAARVVADACAALAHVHAVDPGDGRPFAHGALSAERLVIAEDGAALVSGLATGGGGEPATDLRALAVVLHECLAGEPPATPARALDGPGIPGPLAAIVDRALGVAPDGPYASAAELGAALAGALPPASHAAVAAYADAILPAAEGDRAALARLVARAIAPVDVLPVPVDVRPASPAVGGLDEVSAELIADVKAACSAPDAVATFAAPAAPAPRRSRAVTVVALVGAAAGFALGFAATRDGVAADLSRVARAWSSRAAAARSSGPAAAERSQGSVVPDASFSAEPPREPAALEREPPSPGPPAPSVRPPPTRRTAPRRTAATRVAKGVLDVTAPPEAEVFLDGRRAGKGSVRREIGAGAHRIEVRLGAARVAERFEVAPGETWTYEVTPTR